MDTTQLTQLVTKAVKQAIAQDKDGALTTLHEISKDGDFQIYAACCGFAQYGKAALIKLYGDQAPTPDTGGWGFQALDGASPPELFANRFLVAYANDDKVTAPALFRTALESEQYVESVWALLGNCAALARMAASARP
ncbi:hypothetical protein [Streptomyces jumonjinensis]|uniref:Uncharacterized protein n=1 Tax=Streptomyces jumonjinensis TaxID=1945 RepID=A0A646KMG0_STRJU|nr:hypothetical protein [Streptomyces jumonjinensis]MQT03131.1 hypothetical protein [Streptomyces jumonjinensis]